MILFFFVWMAEAFTLLFTSTLLWRNLRAAAPRLRAASDKSVNKLLCLLSLNPGVLLTCLSRSVHVFPKSGSCSFSLFTLLSEGRRQEGYSIHNAVYL